VSSSVFFLALYFFLDFTPLLYPPDDSRGILWIRWRYVASATSKSTSPQ